MELSMNQHPSQPPSSYQAPKSPASKYASVGSPRGSSWSFVYLDMIRRNRPLQSDGSPDCGLDSSENSRSLPWSYSAALFYWSVCKL